MDDPSSGHAFVDQPAAASTSADCTCGLWHREVGTQEVVALGRTREDILRAAFAAHVAETAGA